MTAPAPLQPPVENPDQPRKSGEIRKGDNVKLRNGKEGEVMYLGDGGLIGLKLVNWSEKGHDGSIKGKRYFTCNPGYGYFTKREAVTDITAGTGPPEPRRMSQPATSNVSMSAPSKAVVDFKVGDKVKTGRGRIGVVRYMGVPDGEKITVVGLELTNWDTKGTEGEYKGKKYFECAQGRGYFTQPEKIAEVVQAARTEPVSQPAAPIAQDERIQENSGEGDNCKVGDTVRLKKGREGIVRYIGAVAGKKGEVMGLELAQWFDKGHNGDLNGKNYYSCKNGTGYWTSRDKVAEILKSAPSSTTPIIRSQPKAVSAQPKGNTVGDHIVVGDEIRLRKGKEGTVRFIGKFDGGKSEVVGIELKQWYDKGHSGSYEKKQYFTCKDGTGYWTKRSAVSDILNRDVNIQALISAASPSTDDDDIVGMFPGDNTGGGLSGYLGLTEDELAEANGESPKPKPVEKEKLEIKLGDRVRLQRGRIGTVKFYGKTDFAQGMVVGLELDQWSEKGNDGSVKGKKYFQTRGSGWGYFTKENAIAEILSDSGGGAP